MKRSKPVAPMFSDESDRNWIRSPIDSFVLRQLKVIGLRPAPPADRRTLIRRISFDLTGLPPTARAVRQFVHDESPGAYENLVDELLTRPEYGERWGQHWLDVVRFAETEGFEYDRHHADAWRFRDYVIDAFNADKPYNRFITEQLAGDEMKFSAADETGRRTAQIAAGFHRLGPIRRNAGNPEVAFSRNEVLTEMTNIVGTTFLGLTLGCARCHDHMYDPIRQKEYYQLQAFMAATHDADIPLADEPARNRWQEKTKQVEQELERLNAAIEAADEQDRDRLNQELKQLRTQLPAQLPTLFSVKNDFAGQTVIHLLEAGDEFKKGVPVGMRTLGIVSRVDESVYPSDVSRPRSGLADWITAPAHPLPARVMVNRIWHYHFGRGIVSTVNDFGFNGAEPSHPELLDFLAERFVSEGWSVKSIHRLILMSSTYQQSSIHPAEHHAKTIDAQNRLLWRFRRRRLEAEEIRDAMLAVSNRLNRQIGGPGIMVPVEQEMIDLLYKPTQWQVTEDSSQHDRRSIYLVAKRNLRLPFLEVFDQPDLQTSCGTRVASTHAPQALEMLNGKLSNELSAAFAERLRIEAGDNIADRIQLAFLITTGCPPTEQQEAVAAKFLKTEPLEEFALAMFSLNGFLYVD
ncbi:MAG: DUF1549 and DUF1553 domain-containing protein [Fuerstiella sp.]|nr:DUF1549 and DUF1553 domain-containing protein [Fuerstiella sp.]